MAKYKHPSASTNQPAAESVTAAHKVTHSGEPTSGVAKLGFKGHKTQPSKKSAPAGLGKFK